MTRVRLAVVAMIALAACGKKADDKPGSGTGSGTTAAGGVDPASWPVRDLADLGTERFSFDATIRVPPDAKTQTSALFDGAGAQIGVVAYIDLADGVRVMLAERAKNAVNDADLLKKFLASTGTVIVDRREPTWFMVAVERDDGIAMQGEFWAVPPGIGCATQRPVTREQLERVTALCATFAPRPPR